MLLSLFVPLSVCPSVACASSVFSSQKILLLNSSIFFEFLCFLFLLDGLLLLEPDLRLFMFLGSSHLTLWTLKTSTFLISLIRSIDSSTAKFLADIGLIVPRLFSFATLTNVSVLKSLQFCSSQDSPTEFSLIFYSFNCSTSVRLSPSEC